MKVKVSAILYVETFLLKLANYIINQVLNHLIKGTRNVRPLTNAHLFSTRVNSTRFNFIGIFELTMFLDIFLN